MIMNDSSEPETFAEEISRQRTSTSAEEDAELIKALETLKQIIERPTRAPRGINDVWGWSVGEEHARQPGTETREQVIERIKRSYKPEAEASARRSQQEVTALETIAAVLESLKEQTGTSRHDLKRVVKALEAIIADKIGPGDAPTEGKGSKLLILPGDETTGRELAEQVAKPVDRPVKKFKSDYIHIRSNEHPVIKSLVEKWGLTAVWVELQRMRRGMLESNPEIAAPLAQVAEEIDDLHEARLVDQSATKNVTTAPVIEPDTDRTLPPNQVADTPPTGSPVDVPHLQQPLLADVLRRVADEMDALQNPGSSPSPLTPSFHADAQGSAGKGETNMLRTTNIKIGDGIEIHAFRDSASIKAKHLYARFSMQKLNPDLVAQSGKYYPFTDEFVDFFRAAEKLILEREKLADEWAAAANRGTISSLRLKWDDDRKGIKRPEYWQFRQWANNFIAHVKEMPPVPNWDLFKELKDWNEWGPRPTFIHNEGP